MSMSNQDKPEVLTDHLQTISYKKENSAMKADGDLMNDISNHKHFI